MSFNPFGCAVTAWLNCPASASSPGCHSYWCCCWCQRWPLLCRNPLTISRTSKWSCYTSPVENVVIKKTLSKLRLRGDLVALGSGRVACGSGQSWRVGLSSPGVPGSVLLCRQGKGQAHPTQPGQAAPSGHILEMWVKLICARQGVGAHGWEGGTLASWA